MKEPTPNRDERLRALLELITDDDRASYRPFAAAAELADLVGDDLAILLTERFEVGGPVEKATSLRTLTASFCRRRSRRLSDAKMTSLQ